MMGLGSNGMGIRLISNNFKWLHYSFSSLFILDVATLSQKDHKLFSAPYILCSKIICNEKIEGSPLVEG